MASALAHPVGRSPLAALTLAALGVVYGDIGTSPLYALKEVFNLGQLPVTPDNVYGVLSLVFWTLTLVVSLKYVTLILRADNQGEGGLVAMLALAAKAVTDRPRLKRALLALGIFGTAIFFGDGVITPAISVLSAVEGLEVLTPALEPVVVPVTLAVLTGLFALQRHGTARIGRLFGPIMAVWFATLATLGLFNIPRHPEVLQALAPHHAAQFVLSQPWIAFLTLGAVVLCVTGAEALYADLGHFGRRPIRLAWFGLVMPALVLNYFGQGALLLDAPHAVENPFYAMAPAWALPALIGLATCATVIASQALITAAFSVTKQVVQLGYLPRQRLLHTSVRDTGQIYIPAVNAALYLGIVAAVVGFGSSSALASAYGIAVTIDMLITTLMTFFVVRYAWRYPWWMCVGATGLFLVIDAVFFAANAVKLLSGGWFPLAIGAAMFTLMTTWHSGRERLAQRLHEQSIELEAFLASIFSAPPLRVPGTAVFLNAEPDVAPNALLHNLKHNKVLHETNLFVTVRHHEVPWIGFDRRVEAQSLGHDCWRVVLNFGFKNDPDVPQALQLLRSQGVPLDEMETSYFLSREIVLPRHDEGPKHWRNKLFAGMHRNATSIADFLHLPANRVVELGAQIEI